MTFLKKNTNAKQHLYHSATLAFIGACQKEIKKDQNRHIQCDEMSNGGAYLLVHWTLLNVPFKKANVVACEAYFNKAVFNKIAKE